MVVQVQSGSDYIPANSNNNGLTGKFGNINLLLAQSVELVFSFKLSTSDKPVTLPYFYFSFFDLDQGSDNVESLCMNYDQFESMHAVSRGGVTHLLSNCPFSFLFF
jgi:hypothetical protein